MHSGQRCLRRASRPLSIVAAALIFATSLSAKPIRFDLPAQPLTEALVSFSKQSGVDVLYSFADMKGVQGARVAGELEPEKALEFLLADTPFKAIRNKEGKFIVTKAAAAPGAIRGALIRPDGGPAVDVSVSVRETGQTVSTDRFGQYYFSEVPPGLFLLVARAEGYQPLHITQVNVAPGKEVILNRQQLSQAVDPTKLDPFVVTAESVTALDEYAVTEGRSKPLFDRNADLPRSINDARPYYIFDSTTIDQSGATNVEDFLKQRLTMNAAALSNSQVALNGTAGNTSSFNLRGVGSDKTLILVNGRRQAGVTISTGSAAATSTPGQPDLNGIPLSAIDRIEILPSSAAGVYGGSALGGVINVILKKNYSGGEVRATYDNTFDSDAPRRTVSMSFGQSLEGGKTQISLNAQWADSQPLLLQDRLALYRRGFNTVLANDPSTIYTTTFTPFLGATPNVLSTSTTGTLTLKPEFGGVSINSRLTYVPAGTSATTSPSALGAALLANAGKWNFDLPDSTQTPTGLRRQFGASPETKSFMASVRRQMLPKLEFFADFSLNENRTEAIFNPLNAVTVTAAAPTNPFTSNVYVRVTSDEEVPMVTASDSRGFTVGAIAKLPHDWTASLDYAWSENSYSYSSYLFDFTTLNADILSGVFNPFVDTALYPLNVRKYGYTTSYEGSSTLDVFSLRGSGPLVELPWGTPSLNTGVEHRVSGNPDRYYVTDNPYTTTFNNTIQYYALDQETDSVFAELLFPLIKRDRFPLLYSLELESAGRLERYRTDTGTISYTTYPNRPTLNGYAGTTLNGGFYRAKERYDADGYSVGLKYQPLPEVTVRGSFATAFIPVSPAQLIVNPAAVQTVGTLYSTWAPGNSDLKPQNSESTNLGIIWEPSWEPLRGFRFNAEYYRIQQFDAITTLSADTIVANESLFPGRVTRNAAGVITLVDTSQVNLYERDSSGWDLSIDYRRRTPFGTFTVSGAESIVDSIKTQYSLTRPAYDAVNFPSEGGATKYKSSMRLNWAWKGFQAGWSTLYYSSYKQYGAAGGPIAQQRAANGQTPFVTYTTRQGGDTIPSQIYHDAFVGYTFGKVDGEPRSRVARVGRKALEDLTIQLGVRNVFDTLPPYDGFYDTNYYISPYGDARLRSYWLNVTKKF